MLWTLGLTNDTVIILHPQHPHDRGGEQPARHGRGHRAHQEVGGHYRQLGHLYIYIDISVYLARYLSKTFTRDCQTLKLERKQRNTKEVNMG